MPRLAIYVMSSSQSTALFLYTIDFPYGETEPYLNNELPYLSRNFFKVVIIAEKKEQRSFNLPDNVEVYFLKELETNETKKALVFKNSFNLLQILLKEFFATEEKLFFIKRWKLTVSELIQALLISEKIKNVLKSQIKPVIHYSFWMNAFPLALSILRKKNEISSFVFRVHGFDLYKERWPKGFIPYRNTNYKYASAIFAVSDVGLNYISANFSYSEKARRSYLGTAENGTNPFKEHEFVIATCSSIIPLKRLNLLAESLKHVSFPLIWYHFGDGKKEEKELLDITIQSLPKHITVHLKGQVNQQTLFDFYNSTPVSVFVNVSETEGLPVSVMEAASFGIPIIATNVGGTREIVNDKTGILVKKDISSDELASVIENFKGGKYNTPEARKEVKRFWENQFSAAHNYQDFCKQLQTLI